MCLKSTATGDELWHHGVFREVSPPERLVFTFVWEEEGERGIENLVTIDFAAQGNKTLMTFRHAPFESTANVTGTTRVGTALSIVSTISSRQVTRKSSRACRFGFGSFDASVGATAGFYGNRRDDDARFDDTTDTRSRRHRRRRSCSPRWAS